MQSCVRRRQARRELKALKAEARSVTKAQEKSFRLENKVVELTQKLQQRDADEKELNYRLTGLDSQLKQWMSKHSDADARAKKLQGDLQAANAEVSRRDELLVQKADVETRLDEALKRIGDKDEAIKKLTDEVAKQAAALEERQKIVDAAPAKGNDDSSIVTTLKREVGNLREQLNRANALNALSGKRPEPTSPTFAPTLRPMENTAATTNGVSNAAAIKKHQRRHSTTGTFSDVRSIRDSADELMLAVKRNQLNNPRAVSVAYNGLDLMPNVRRGNLTDIYDDPAEEKIKLLDDALRLDEDVLQGLVRSLKMPVPNSPNVPSPKEVLFPANLISLITNEMWKYGLIAESERFLANVMQTVQAHVMVCPIGGDLSELLLMSCLVVVHRRGGDHARSFLAVQRPRDPVVHLSGGVRHVARHWSWRRPIWPRIRMV